jgi:hypothetical protein
MYCKGECGSEAKFGNWCTEKFNKCPGYRKKISIAAKKRGNNGVRGSLSKSTFKQEIIEKYNIKDFDQIYTFSLTCHVCNEDHIIDLKPVTVTRNGYKFICKKCKYQRQSESYVKNRKYEELGYNKRKEIIWKEQGLRCNKCELNSLDFKTGPYQLHHIDGNIKNKKRENEEVLCMNCHFFTDNYGFRGRKHTEEAIEKIVENHKMRV